MITPRGANFFLLHVDPQGKEGQTDNGNAVLLSSFVIVSVCDLYNPHDSCSGSLSRVLD